VPRAFKRRSPLGGMAELPSTVPLTPSSHAPVARRAEQAKARRSRQPSLRIAPASPGRRPGGSGSRWSAWHGRPDRRRGHRSGRGDSSRKALQSRRRDGQASTVRARATLSWIDSAVAVQTNGSACLVHAQHDRVLWRVRVPNYVGQLLREQRSLDTLNVSTRCGLRSRSSQIGCTVDALTPNAAVIERHDQRVAPGVVVNVADTIASTFFAEVDDFGPRPART